MARRSDHTREELRGMILSAAKKIVAQGGHEKLTARAIAAEIGYAAGTIYNFFSSMEELALAINADTLERLGDEIAALQGGAGANGTSEKLKALAFLYIRFADENRPFWLMLFSGNTLESEAGAQWYRDRIAALFLPLEQILSPLFAPEEARAKIMASRTLFAAVHGLCWLRQLGRLPQIDGQAAEAEMVGYLIDTFLAGISGRAAGG